MLISLTNRKSALSIADPAAHTIEVIEPAELWKGTATRIGEIEEDQLVRTCPIASLNRQYVALW